MRNATAKPIGVRRTGHAVGKPAGILHYRDRLPVSKVGKEDQRPGPQRSDERYAGHIHEYPFRNDVVEGDADQHKRRRRGDARCGDVLAANLCRRLAEPARPGPSCRACARC